MRTSSWPSTHSWPSDVFVRPQLGPTWSVAACLADFRRHVAEIRAEILKLQLSVHPVRSQVERLLGSRLGHPFAPPRAAPARAAAPLQMLASTVCPSSPGTPDASEPDPEPSSPDVGPEEPDKKNLYWRYVGQSIWSFNLRLPCVPEQSIMHVEGERTPLEERADHLALELLRSGEFRLARETCEAVGKQVSPDAVTAWGAYYGNLGCYSHAREAFESIGAAEELMGLAEAMAAEIRGDPVRFRNFRASTRLPYPGLQDELGQVMRAVHRLLAARRGAGNGTST